MSSENYVFSHDKVYVLDFESSWEHANFVHDLGIVAAELKHYFAMHKGNDKRAEPYSGHFLWHYSRDMESSAEPVRLCLSSSASDCSGWPD